MTILQHKVRNASRRSDSTCLHCLASGIPAIAVTALFVAFAGCSDGRPDRITVSGRVLIDGEPLKTGIVQFVPEGARPSGGKIGEDGSFTLTCYDSDDGIVPGTHRVAVIAKEMVSESKAKWHAPPKYSDFRKSGLSFEITEPTDDLTIELNWDGGKPPVK